MEFCVVSSPPQVVPGVTFRTLAPNSGRECSWYGTVREGTRLLADPTGSSAEGGEVAGGEGLEWCRLRAPPDRLGLWDSADMGRA